MKETVHEIWTIGTNRFKKVSLMAGEWWSSALGVVPYVSRTSLQEDYLLCDQSMQGGNVTLVHIECFYVFVLFRNL
jgi:hypothetical protein